MRTPSPGPIACCLFLSACLSAAEIRGKVVDPSGAPIPGAQISVVSLLGVEAQTVSAINGTFELNARETAGTRVVIAAPGFATRSVPAGDASTIELRIAPQSDSVEVVGSAIAVPASEQGGSVTIVSNQDVRRRNEPLALDLLRYTPGVAFNQTGATGSVASLFLRGGYSSFNLVQVDGVPVNSFGGAFDFAHIPAEMLDRVEVIRGPQSAVYGPYANSGAINFITRQPTTSPEMDIVAEGGTYHERRFGVSGSGTIGGFGIAASASRMDTDGPVVNSDYRNEGLLLNVSRRFGRHQISLHADFDSNEVGEPGPWGSDPAHTFTGIDTVSREKSNFSDYFAHYQADLSPRVRQELFGSFFLDNIGFNSPFGFSFNKDLRGQGESRTIFSISRHYTAAVGVSAGREQVRNTYISDATFDNFPVRRTDVAVYLENRFVFGERLFVNAGVRGEFLRTPSIPPDGFSRPFFPANSISTANPRISAAWLPAAQTRLHAAFATGIRPPSGFELAFTDNPALKPERTRSFEAGIEQTLLGQVLRIDGTYFYNRYYDLIVTLGGTLAYLSRYQSANLANSRAQGLELSAALRPARWVFVTGSYTLLGTRILSLAGSSGVAPLAFHVGQPLTRRPENAGSVVATFTLGRASLDATGTFRGSALFEEPAYGASNGLFWNPGYTDIGFNLNYSLGRGVTAYGNLRNALNRHYEEVLGFPSPRLNFVAGLKWHLGKETWR
jgi:outer membrane receptor protein involved in Fe transport